MNNFSKAFMIAIATTMLISCTLISFKEDSVLERTQFSTAEEWPLLKIKVIKLRAPEYLSEDISQSKTGREIWEELQNVRSYFIKSGIDEVIVEFDVSQNMNHETNGFFGVLPEIYTADVAVTWKGVKKDSSVLQLASRSKSYKAYGSMFLFPYGLLMSIARPLSGNWDSDLGFFNNFWGYAIRDIQTTKINAAMIQDLVQQKIIIPL